MRIVAVRTRLVRWQLHGTGAARGRTERAAILVEVTTDAGHKGLGEAAPLPGMSPPGDDLEAAAAALAALAARVPFDVAPELLAIAAIAADLAPVPSARFAIETALATAAASEHGCPLADLLAPSPVRTLPCAVVVDDLAAAFAATTAGARALKVKVGDQGDLARVHELARALPGVRLRLDANQRWPAAGLAERLRDLAGLPIEFLEEPCADPTALLGERLACPLALDESLATLDDDALTSALHARGLAAIVIKPTLVGGLAAALALAARARAAGTDVVITHALEGPIGTAACAELALALGGAPAGLAPHAALAGWPVTPPQLRATSLEAQPAPGLGITTALDAIAPEDPAVITPSRTWSHADLAALASTWPGGGGVQVVLATPTLETLVAIHAALAARRPIALLHAKLHAAELARQRALAEAAHLPPDAAAILFTSGSTGPARGVVLGRGALDAAAQASARTLGWRPGDRWLLALSTAHAGGLAVVVRCRAAGYPVVLVEEAADLDAALACATLASLVPTQLAQLLDDPAWRPASTLRAVLLGGAAAPRALLATASARGVPFLTSYGLTETFGQIATAALDRAGDPDAPLVPLPGVDVRGGTRVAPELLRVRGRTLALAYLDGAPIAPELVTADLGFVDDEGVHVVGRADDVIITGGENVHPAMVEAVLAATPGVRAACVFGVPDPRWGQVVAAAIAIDATFDPVAAAAAWHAELPPHARPRRLATTRSLPLLPGGKHDRRAAADLPGAPVAYR